MASVKLPTPAQARRAYKKAALALHPDKALAHCRFAPRMGVQGAKLADAAQVRSVVVALSACLGWQRRLL